VLYSTSSEVILYHTREPSMTSIYRPNLRFVESMIPGDRRMDVIREERVTATTLDIALMELGIESIDFLKLDTQGSELDILRGASSALEGLCAIELEIEFDHIYEKQPLFPEVHAFLISRGFRFMDFPKVFTTADFRFSHRGLRGYDSVGGLLLTWLGKLRAPGGAWRGGGQVLYADAVYLRDPNGYLETAGVEGRRRVLAGVFIASVLDYYEHAHRLIQLGVQLGHIDDQERAALVRLTNSASRSVGPILRDLGRGFRRISRRLVHPGR
jgi:hypothetical protein